MNAPGRRRIVINLDQPASGGEAAGGRVRLSRVLTRMAAVLAVILVVAGVSIFLWWRHYRTTPTYSLALIVEAAQRNDLPAFDRLVDSDKLVDSLAAQTAEKVSSRLGVPSSILSSQLNSVTPMVPAQLRSTFKEWLAEEIKQFSSQFGGKPFVFVALTLPALVKVTKAEDTARVEAKLHGEPVELFMQREEGDVWRLVGFKDDGLLTRVLNTVKELPALGPVNSVDPARGLRRERR